MTDPAIAVDEFRFCGAPREFPHDESRCYCGAHGLMAIGKHVPVSERKTVKKSPLAYRGV